MPSMCTGPLVSSRTRLAMRKASTTPWQYPRGVILRTCINLSLRGRIWWHDQRSMAVAAAPERAISERAIEARQARMDRFRAMVLDLIVFGILSFIVNNVY